MHKIMVARIQTQKQFAESCSYDWILSLDADEKISDALGQEIKGLSLDDLTLAYEFKRISYFLGKPVHFSGWQNDYVVRLFNRQKAHFSDDLVHEKSYWVRKQGTTYSRGYLSLLLSIKG